MLTPAEDPFAGAFSDDEEEKEMEEVPSTTSPAMFLRFVNCYEENNCKH